MRILLLISISLATLGWGSVAQADERYYIIIFGSQSTPRLPRFTHAWATFVKASGEGENSCAYHIDETFTISWMPADLKIRALRLRAQEGVNLGPEATIENALERERVSQWGPYQISPRLYDWGLEQKCRLESGVVKYKTIDPNVGPRVRYVSNCIHAVSDLDPEHGRLYYLELRRFGEAASHWLAHQLVFRGQYINLGDNLDWINHQLGLDRYPIVHRPPPEHRLWLLDR
jgi:hypothetical protein